MKNYYYFLGIPHNASCEDIKKAYRKLSIKYHPDKNDNDVFFSDRFKEVNEAYEILIDFDKRACYDKVLFTRIQNDKNFAPPKIKNFSASKIRAVVNEEITIYWNTYDADIVKIFPFGLENLNGERIVKIKEFDSNGKFQILLHATNTTLRKTVVSGISISDISVKTTNNDDYEKPNYKTKELNIIQRSPTTKFVIIIVFIFFLISVWLIFS